MATKLKAKTKSRKPAKKKTAQKKIAAKKKTTAKSKALKARKKPVKKAAKKTAKKRTEKTTVARGKTTMTLIAAAKQPEVLPGPPRVVAPPVEEPIPQEAAVGVVTHYYSDLGVAVVQLNTGELRIGDTIHIKGHTSDFTQQLTSIEYEHGHIDMAVAGQKVGIKVADHAREHDIVYVVR